MGLYRGDGAAGLKLTPHQMEQTKSRAECLPKTTIKTNKNTIDILNVLYNLTLETIKPYSKHNTTHLYMNNPYPENVKNLSNEEILNNAAPEYQEALTKFGYDYTLKYDPDVIKPETEKPNKQNRKRNITWFDPPYSTSVKTRVRNNSLNWLTNAS